MTALTDDANQLAKRHGTTVARAGWAAKGVVYALIGVLTLQIALGDPSGSADQEGALRAVADQSFGSVLLVVLAVGLVAYAVGRLLEATLFAGPDDEALDRARSVGSAVLYTGLAVLAVQVLTTSSDGGGQGSGGGQGGQGSGGSGGGGGDQASSLTADVMDAPLGRWVIGLVGLALIAAAIYEARRGVRQEFMEELETGEMSTTARRTAERLGMVGLVARGVSWALIGWFLVQAAVQCDPAEAKGLDETLRSLADEGWGTALLLLVALGFIAYGAYCAVHARYRDVQ